MKQEIKRKSLHLISLIFPFSLLFINDKWIALFVLVFTAVLNILIDKYRSKIKFVKNIYHFFFGDILRDHEKEGKFTGATNYFISLAISYTIYYILLKQDIKHIIIAYVGFMLGDAAAALVGKSVGKIKLINNKTLEGSVACFIASLASTFWLSPQLMLPIKIAAIITILELIVYKIDDNFFVPLFTLGILYFII